MPNDIVGSYNQVAKEYVKRIYDELAQKPFDRKMLDWVIEKVGDLGMICDMGCGPGQIARYLHEQGATSCGIDLSPGMIEQAKQLNPDIAFQVGDMLSLSEVEDETFGGIACFYSIIHFSPDQLTQALKELHRVLRPEGVILITFHIGDEVKHLGKWWGHQVSVDFHFYQTAIMKDGLVEVGFNLEEVIERDPYPEPVEVQTRRTYLFARK